jgi:hypothetical protein
MNDKFDNARSDPGVNPSTNNVVLEIRATSSSSPIDEIRGNIQKAYKVRQRVETDKVRIVKNDRIIDEVILTDK